MPRLLAVLTVDVCFGPNASSYPLRFGFLFALVSCAGAVRGASVTRLVMSSKGFRKMLALVIFVGLHWSLHPIHEVRLGHLHEIVYGLAFDATKHCVPPRQLWRLLQCQE